MRRSLSSVTMAFAFCTLLAGCGGGGSSAPVAGGGPVLEPTPANLPAASLATFSVDMTTGKVAVSTPQGGDSRSVFTGSALTYTPSDLRDVPGSPGMRSIHLLVGNNWPWNISNARLVFSPINAFSAPLDLRPQTKVATYTGTGTVSSVDGPVASATFTGPAGVAVGPDGTVFVSDNKVIRRIKNGRVSTIAGGGVAGTNGVGATAGFFAPAALATNQEVSYTPSSLVAYVADQGGWIRRVTVDGTVTTVAGNGTAGNADGAGNFATLSTPTGVAVTDVNNTKTIFVTEFSGNRIRRIDVPYYYDTSDPANYTVTTVAGSPAGTAGATEGIGTAATFKGPSGIAVGDDNALYVCDRSNNKIRRYDINTHEVSTVAGTGVAGTLAGTGDTARLNAPVGITFWHGAFYVTDYTGAVTWQISHISGAPANQAKGYVVQLVAGTAVAGFNDGAGTVAQFNGAQHLAADLDGSLLIPDLVNRRIRRVMPEAGILPIGSFPSPASTNLASVSNAVGVIPSTLVGTNSPYIPLAFTSVLTGSTSYADVSFIVPSGVSAFQFQVCVEGDSGVLTPPDSGVGVGGKNVQVDVIAGLANVNGFLNGTGASARFSQPRWITTDDSGYVTIA
ncbi:MAG: hypothetical protein ABUL72_04390, partial [Armatimonadota bacterium]